MTHIEPVRLVRAYNIHEANNSFIKLENKLNEVIGDYEHLKEVVLCRQLESNKSSDNPTPGTEPISGTYEVNRYATASNQSNTEPNKIKLHKQLGDRPAGEYILEGEGMSMGTVKMYFGKGDLERYGRAIPRDIIKSTSGQGIRSEVTDGEESVSRPINPFGAEMKGYTKEELKRMVQCSTPQTEPIESLVEQKLKYTSSYEPYIEEVCKWCGELLHDDGLDNGKHFTCYRNELMGFKKPKQLSRKIENSIPVPPPLESKYEEAANGIREMVASKIGTRHINEIIPMYDVIKELKKYF